MLSIVFHTVRQTPIELVENSYIHESVLSLFGKIANVKTAARKLGQTVLDMDPLKEAEVIPLRCNRHGEEYFDVFVQVRVELLEGFMHSIKCSAEWAPDLEDRIDVVSGWQRPSEDDEDVDMMAEERIINLAAHFEASTT